MHLMYFQVTVQLERVLKSTPKYGLYIVSCGFHAYFDMGEAQCHYLWTYKTRQLDHGNRLYLLSKFHKPCSWNRVDSLIRFPGWEQTHIRKFISDVVLITGNVIETFKFWLLICIHHVIWCLPHVSALVWVAEAVLSSVIQFSHLRIRAWSLAVSEPTYMRCWYLRK